MIADHELWTKSSDLLAELLSSDTIIRNLSAEFNTYAPQFRINKIAEIINADNSKSLNCITVLSSIVHLYISHNQDYEKNMTTVLKPIKEKLVLFMTTLNENGRNGLHLNYLAENQQRNETHKIHSVNDELVLKMIYNDNEPIGILPLIKLEIIKENQIDKPEYFILPIHILKNLSKAFSNMYNTNITQINAYKNKLDNNMIIYDY